MVDPRLVNGKKKGTLDDYVELRIISRFFIAVMGKA